MRKPQTTSASGLVVSSGRLCFPLDVCEVTAVTGREVLPCREIPLAVGCGWPQNRKTNRGSHSVTAQAQAPLQKKV